MTDDYLYGNYVKNLHTRFMRRLEDIEAYYNFDYGQEFEIAICEILRSFLPTRYGICRGFVVNSKGETGGDDIIIYDQEKFPTLRSLIPGNFSLKEQIPVEAVYVYIEAKHTLAFTSDLTQSTLRTAFKQCSEVKRLINGRNKVNVSADKIYEYRSLSNTFPDLLNPAFSIVLSRNVSYNGKIITDRQMINNLLYECELETDINNPDFVIAGPHNLITPSLEVNDEQYQTIFCLPKHPYFTTSIISRQDMSYGILIAELGFVLNWITLGNMPWEKILADACKPISSDLTKKYEF